MKRIFKMASKRIGLGGLTLGLLATIICCNNAFASTKMDTFGKSSGSPKSGDLFVGLCGIGYDYRITVDVKGFSWSALSNQGWSNSVEIPVQNVVSHMTCLAGNDSNDYTYITDLSSDVYLDIGQSGQYSYDNWVSLGQADIFPITAMVTTSGSDFVYIGDETGRVLSAASGSTTPQWKNAGVFSGGPGSAAITSLAIGGGGNSGALSSYVLAATQQKYIWMKPNAAGGNWLQTNGTPLPEVFYYMASNNGSLYVYGSSQGAETWVYNLPTSSGQQSAWKELPALGNSKISAISITPDDAFVYLGDQSGLTWVRTNDGGTQAWTSLPKLPSYQTVIGFAVFPASPSIVIAEDVDGNTYWRNEGDNTSQWMSIGQPIIAN